MRCISRAFLLAENFLAGQFPLKAADANDGKEHAERLTDTSKSGSRKKIRGAKKRTGLDFAVFFAVELACAFSDNSVFAGYAFP